MTYWRCFYHVVWATKHRAPLITSDLESLIFRVIRARSTDSRCEVLALNSVADHVHVAVNIPPSIAVAAWVKQGKGVSAREVNRAFPDTHFHWQEGYGVHTFAERDLTMIVAYIQRQKEHHAQNDLLAYLERLE